MPQYWRQSLVFPPRLFLSMKRSTSLRTSESTWGVPPCQRPWGTTGPERGWGPCPVPGGSEAGAPWGGGGGREDEGFGGERGSMGDTVHIRNLQKFSALCYHAVMGPVGSPGCITPGCSHLPPLLWCHCPRKVMVSGILLAAG